MKGLLSKHCFVTAEFKIFISPADCGVWTHPLFLHRSTPLGLSLVECCRSARSDRSCRSPRRYWSTGRYRTCRSCWARGICGSTGTTRTTRRRISGTSRTSRQYRSAVDVLYSVAVADLSQKASSATDQEGIHFYVGSDFHRPTSETRGRPPGVGVKRT